MSKGIDARRLTLANFLRISALLKSEKPMDAMEWVKQAVGMDKDGVKVKHA